MPGPVMVMDKSSLIMTERAVCGLFSGERDQRIQRVAAVRLHRPDMQEQVHLGRGQHAVSICFHGT